MRHAAFTSIEGFWLLRNLLLSSVTTGSHRPRTRSADASSARDDVKLGAAALGFQPGDLFRITTGEFKMSEASPFIWRHRRSRPLLGRPSRVIDQISFHCCHPPMARPNDTPHASRGTEALHISSTLRLADSLKSTP